MPAQGAQSFCISRQASDLTFRVKLNFKMLEQIFFETKHVLQASSQDLRHKRGTTGVGDLRTDLSSDRGSQH